jgi:iron-sulfur cluster repair protein YtfE (RIC family)
LGFTTASATTVSLSRRSLGTTAKVENGAGIGRIAAPRLRTLVSNLHGHHQVEDYHYFPAFRAAESRLAAGFDVLDSDHDELQRTVTAALAALRELRAAAEQPTATSGDSAALAARQYVAAVGTLCRRLIRHLSDEEDLVIPLLIERGDY